MKQNTKFITGASYKGWSVLDVFDVPDYHSTAVYLRHRKTGLEVFHMLNDDEENLFSFTFRTPCTNSRGIPHILEHSVLCGSKKYPLKDPFIRMVNQSVNTFMNAMTYPDRTVFPASTMVKADYFHLMSVYGDAVFFPLLKKEVFEQEAHRLEIDEDGNASIQGVVYNEMKGSYASFDAASSDEALRSIMRGSVYEKDSGGDPLNIPELTYEEFISFHKKYYTADNCLVFLYGTISTEEQLDFIQKEFLDRIEKSMSQTAKVKCRTYKEVSSSFVKLVKPSVQKKPVSVRAIGPAGDDDDVQSDGGVQSAAALSDKKSAGSTVLVNWNLGTVETPQKAVDFLVLAGILMNHDGSPLRKALLESGLGEDIPPAAGVQGYLYNCVLSAGLRGVKKQNERKVEKCIDKIINSLAKDGIPQEDIDSTLMSIEFEHREIRRSHGPYSLSLMNGSVYGWLYGWGPRNGLCLRSALDDVSEKIRNDKSYLSRLIKKYIINNKARSFVVTVPSPLYMRKRNAAEKRIIAALLKKTGVQTVKKNQAALAEFQQKEEDCSCLPHLKPSDFLGSGSNIIDRIVTKTSYIKSCETGRLPLFTNCENTNGIIYFDAGFPADVLSPAQYRMLPLFAECAADCGWNGLSWAQTAEQTALCTGGISVSLIASESSSTPDARRTMRLAKKNAAKKGCASWCGREWVVFRVGMLEEEAHNALDLLASCICGTDFSDTKRIADIARELRNNIDSSVIPYGSSYASMRTKRMISRAKAVDELWNGLSSLFAIHELASADMEKTAASFRKILSTIRQGGAFLHVTAEQSGISLVKKLLPEFILKVNLKPVRNPSKFPDSRFMSLTNLGAETFIVPSQVGFAAESCGASTYCTKEEAGEEVCTNWLSNTVLWEQLRTIGGAYSASCSTEPFAGVLTFTTYRDPKPHLSCGVFESCIKKAAGYSIDSEEADRAVIGSYSHLIQPRSPQSRGSTGLLRTLYGVTDKDREKKARFVLAVTPADMEKTLSRISKFLKKNNHPVVICNKTREKTGKIVVLPL
jgi:Zn-dependent M16 (insulinase) family peptidase